MSDRPMREALQHIIRPMIPWREGEPGLTECGRAQTDVAQWITLEEFIIKVRREGQQRSAMTTCMTCWSRAAVGARVQEDWGHRPSAVIEREILRSGQPESRLDTELRAIALLIQAHREEFDSLISGLQDAISLDARRQTQKGRR